MNRSVSTFAHTRSIVPSPGSPRLVPCHSPSMKSSRASPVAAGCADANVVQSTMTATATAMKCGCEVRSNRRVISDPPILYSTLRRKPFAGVSTAREEQERTKRTDLPQHGDGIGDGPVFHDPSVLEPADGDASKLDVLSINQPGDREAGCHDVALDDLLFDANGHVLHDATVHRHGFLGALDRKSTRLTSSHSQIS